MAVVTPSASARPVDGGISTVSTPRRRIGIVGLSSLGLAAQTLHTADPELVKSTFGTGELVEGALHVLRNSKKPVAVDLGRINPSVAGYAMDVTTQRVGESEGVLTVTGAPNDAYSVVVEMMADAADLLEGDGEMRISLDGGDSFGNVVAIPVNGIYEIPGTGLTLTFTTGDDYETGDKFLFDCVGPGFSSVDLGNALAALRLDGYQYKTLFVMGTGPSAAASAALAATVLAYVDSLENDRHFTWGIVQAKHGLTNGTVVESGTPTPTEHITLSGVPKLPSYSFRIEITTTGGRGAGVFRWSSDGGTSWTASVTITASTGINVLGTTGVTVTFANASYTAGNVFSWTPRTETDAEVRDAFAAVNGWRIGKCAGEIEHESSLFPGRKNRRGLIYAALLKEAEDELHHDMGRVKNGTLRCVTAIYRDELKSPGLDPAQFITSTTYPGEPGKFYITQGNTCAPDGSVFDLSQYVNIINEACRITQEYLNQLPNEDFRTNADGTIADEDAVTIDDQLRSLLDAGLTANDDVQKVQARVRRDLSLASTRKLSVRVTMVPPFYAKQVEGEVGFAVTLTAA